MGAVISKSSKPRERLLALDQASYRTGFALYDGAVLTGAGCLEACAKDSAKRILQMAYKIETAVQTRRPDFVVFEDVQDQKSTKTVILLARLQGMILYIADRYRIPCEIYAPAAWRKTLGFRQGAGVTRQELKSRAASFVRDAYHINTNEDTCEAICIGLAYLRTAGFISSFDNLHKEIVSWT